MAQLQTTVDFWPPFRTTECCRARRALPEIPPHSSKRAKQAKQAEDYSKGRVRAARCTVVLPSPRNDKEALRNYSEKGNEEVSIDVSNAKSETGIRIEKWTETKVKLG